MTSSAKRVVVSSPGHIFVVDCDGDDGAQTSGSFSRLTSYRVPGNPSWLAVASARHVYAVDEAGDQTRLFELPTRTSGCGEEGLKLVVEAKGSRGVAHLAFNRARTRMLGAGWGSGQVDVWDTEGQGLRLLKTISLPNQQGDGLVSRPHQCVLDPSGRFFAVNDMGLDRVFLLDSRADVFDVVGVAALDGGLAGGPRHGSFYPSAGVDRATHYVLVCELSNRVHVWALGYTGDGIDFTPIQAISTFAPDAPPEACEGAAAGELLVVDDDVYVSNRLVRAAPTDSIAHFKFTPFGPHDPASSTPCTMMSPPSGPLHFAGQVSSGGRLPRMFSVSRDKASLLVGNQEGAHGVVVIPRAPDGTLSPTPWATLANAEIGGGHSRLGPEYVEEIGRVRWWGDDGSSDACGDA